MGDSDPPSRPETISEVELDHLQTHQEPFFGNEDIMASFQFGSTNASFTAELIESHDELLVPHNRTINLYIFVIQCSLFILAITSGVLLSSHYSKSYYRKCDEKLKVWSLIWLIRFCVQLLANLTISTYRLKQLTVPYNVFLLARLTHLFGLLWWFWGFRVIFYSPRCPDETVALYASRAMFYFTSMLCILPLSFYLVFLLFLPCLIFLMIRFSVPPIDRRPTPRHIRDQLEIKLYSEVLAVTSEVDNEAQPTIKQGLSSMFGGVSALLSGVSSSITPPNELVGSYSTLDSALGCEDPKSCPICMAEFHGDDQVVIMPCDARHLFHQHCVFQWLDSSQVCPICRANIVDILTHTDSLQAV